MTVLVNYYTCSYGDSLVNMFNGQPVRRVNGIALCNYNKFVEPIFYEAHYQDRQQDWQGCQNLDLQAVPCHRQHGFDFSQEFQGDVKVISLILDRMDFLANRFHALHLERRNKVILDKTLASLLARYPQKYQDIICKDYEIWQRTNCFPTDVQFKFSWIQDQDRVRAFCQAHGLGFDPVWLQDIMRDLEQYVMP